MIQLGENVNFIEFLTKKTTENLALQKNVNGMPLFL